MAIGNRDWGSVARLDPITTSMHLRGGGVKRSIVKAVTYRVVIVCLDFLAVYLMTGKTAIALGFMVVSNLYTTVGYFVHERIWARISWGRAGPPPATS